MEIERKYLVKDIPKEFDNSDFVQIKQAYLDFGDSVSPEKRIRIMSSAKSSKYFYTEKSMGDLCRDEKEFEIDEQTFFGLFTKSISKVIEKERHYIHLQDGLLAELDIYKGEHKGLITVEVEFPSKTNAENFIKPYWFGEEITYDKKYKNKNLAK